MGIYCTSTSLEVIMIGTTFDTLTTALSDKSMEWAENEINKHLSKRYDVGAFMTAGSVPPMVTTICEWLSAGYMYDNMSRGGADGQMRADRYIKRAMDDVFAIKEYKLQLVDTVGSVIADFSNTAYQIRCNTSTYSPTFNEDKPLKWKVDQDKLDDIESERD